MGRSFVRRTVLLTRMRCVLRISSVPVVYAFDSCFHACLHATGSFRTTGCCQPFVKFNGHCRDAIMIFNDQDRECIVTLSAAKGLARWAERCFAALSMTRPALIVKLHYRIRYQHPTPLRK